MLLRRALIVTLSLALFVGVGLTVTADVEGSSVKIGCVFPISGVGADCGKREHIGAQLAVNEINAAGGIDGVPFELVVEDSAGEPQEAVLMVNKLAQGDKVIAIVGPHYSGEAEVTFPVGNQIGIVQIAVASSKPGVAEANRPWPFRNTLTEDKIATPVVQTLIEEFGIEKVAVFYDAKEAVCSSIGKSVYPPILESLGVEIINADNPITYETGKPQFIAEITRLKGLNADAVVLGALGADALNIVTEARRQGVNIPFFGGAPLFEGNVPERGGSMVNDIYGGTIWYYELDTEANQAFVAGFEELAAEMYPEIGTTPTYYAPNAYDAVYMVKEAMEEMGATNNPSDLSSDREKIRDYFSTLTDFEGVASNGFNEVGDGVKTVYVLRTLDGKWEMFREF